MKLFKVSYKGFFHVYADSKEEAAEKDRDFDGVYGEETVTRVAEMVEDNTEE